MKMIQVPFNKFETIKKEQHDLSNLTYEVDQALKFYNEHPQYQFDFGKIRDKISEINSRMHNLEESINEINKSKLSHEEDTSTEIWL